MEPLNALALQKDGKWEIHTGNQWQSLVLPWLAAALEVQRQFGLDRARKAAERKAEGERLQQETDDLIEKLQDEMQSVFDRPTPWTLNSARIDKVQDGYEVGFKGRYGSGAVKGVPAGRYLSVQYRAMLDAAPPPAADAVTDDEVMQALRRLWPLIERGTKGFVFTAEKAGEVAADMATLRAALAARGK